MKAEQLPQSFVIPALEKQKTRDPQGEPARIARIGKHGVQ